MPIRIPNDLPATGVLQSENIFVITETRAITQDIRPLRIALLNLMPTKIATETQFARLLGNTPLQVELTLLQTRSHQAHNTSQEHMLAFYKTIDDVCEQKFDGMIITGAPVEQMPFERVDYWTELCEIMDWTQNHVHSTMHICWGAQAGLYHYYGVPKIPLEKKLFGIYPHVVTRRSSMLLRGFDDVFMAPHSRHTTIDAKKLEGIEALRMLAVSDEAGAYAMATDKGRRIFITGHSEYDTDTLEREYLRDKNAGLPIEMPVNYYPNDDDSKRPLSSWRGHANLLFSNWLNYYVYQTTPYDVNDINFDYQTTSIG